MHWLSPAVSVYDPLGHTLHTVIPVMLCAVPAAHTVQIDLPWLFWYHPVLQLVHTLKPSAFENFPAGHSGHVVWPVSPCAVPALQIPHTVVPVAVCLYPIGHATHALAPIFAEAYVPTPHVVQELEALAGWALPSGHCKHIDCSADPWYHPTLQSVHTVALPAANLPAGHTSHDAPPAAPLALPTGQLLQNVCPCDA
jgi:hypothetical protein